MLRTQCLSKTLKRCMFSVCLCVFGRPGSRGRTFLMTLFVHTKFKATLNQQSTSLESPSSDNLASTVIRLKSIWNGVGVGRWLSWSPEWRKKKPRNSLSTWALFQDWWKISRWWFHEAGWENAKYVESQVVVFLFSLKNLTFKTYFWFI